MEFYIALIIFILIFGYVIYDEGKKDEKRIQDVLDRDVIKRFGWKMEKHGSHIIIKDVKYLYDSKLEILGSLCRQIAIEKNDERLNNLKVALIFLASYQNGVGDEDLYPEGFDIQKTYEKTKELPAKEILEFVVENSEAIDKHQKRYEHFKTLCEKDQKEFYTRIGCSWPPTLP